MRWPVAAWLVLALALAGCGGQAASASPGEPGQPSVVRPGPANASGQTPLGAAVGTTLHATTGAWTGTVTSYTYQWQRCGSGGGSCASIAGANAPAYTLRAADAGASIRVVITAHGSSGAASRTSAATGIVTSASDARSGGDVAGSSTISCFASPGTCGYPDPKHAWVAGDRAWATGGGGVGPESGGVSEACSSLPDSGSVTTSTDGQTISNLNVTGQIKIQNANVTVRNVCVTENGGGAEGSWAVKVTAAGALIENSTIGGANSSTQSVQDGVLNFGGSSNVVTMTHDHVYNCGECLNTGSWDVSDSYILNNGMYGTTDHLEAMYIDGGGNTVAVTHDTMFSPPGYTDALSPLGYQAAVLFGDTNGGVAAGPCSTRWHITNNLLAGDGFILRQCANSTGVGTATLRFTGNSIARCHGPTAQTPGGNWYCTSTGVQNGDGSNRNGDGYGFAPFGGYYGVATAYCDSATWSDNVWDDDGLPVEC